MAFCSFRHFGRMGNYLYSAAAAYGYSKKHGLNFSSNNVTNDQKWNPCYLQHLVLPEFDATKEDVLINEIWTIDQHYQEIEFKEEWRNQNIFLNGYNQSYKYFDFCREEMIKDFNFDYSFKKATVGIHIRRGDYLLHPTKHPVVTVGYLKEAMTMIEWLTNYGDSFGATFEIYSDDIEWCKSVFPEIMQSFPYWDIIYSEGRNEVEDMTEMSGCEHQIISNSTLAYWAAELNQNKDKIVISPSEHNWFGRENQAKMTVKDLIRPEWKQIRY